VIALSTDYDCWHETHDDVSVDAIIAIIKSNVATAKKIIRCAVQKISGQRSCPCSEALKYAVISDTSVMPVETRENLELIIGKYLQK
jgi:5'-methylthioadenosine phosphorylase